MPAAAAVAAFALFAFAPQVLNDGDTFWHIATGNWMLDHRAVPSVDPFSFTHFGAPWVTHEWLAELLMALGWRAAGWDGVVLLDAAATALALWMLARHLLRWLAPMAALLGLLLAATCLAPSLLARPHVLALPVLEAWTAGLLLARSRGQAPSAWLWLLMALWANLHGSFLFGLALTLPLATEAVLEAPRSGVAMRGWGVFIAGAVVAATLTPHGVRGLLFPLELLRMRELAHVGEWRPVDFSSAQPIEIALVALLYVAFTYPLLLSRLRLVIVLVLLAMALAHGRHQMLAGIVGALVLAEPFGDGVMPPARVRMWAAGALAAVVALAGLRLDHPIDRGADPRLPTQALLHVPPALRQAHVFNEYGFGGYLIFSGIAPFIDSRADVYGDAFLASYAAIVDPDRAAFGRAVARYDIGWALLAARSPLRQVLDLLPEWRLLYADDVAAVYARTVASP